MDENKNPDVKTTENASANYFRELVRKRMMSRINSDPKLAELAKKVKEHIQPNKD